MDFEEFGNAKIEFLRSFLALPNGIPSQDTFRRENGLVLGQIKTGQKSNEITAIPELLRTLQRAGCIVTIGAMGCQKPIASEISSAKADDVLARKGHQSTLHEEVARFMEAAQAHDFKGVTHDFLETTTRAHGRVETRRYSISEEIERLTHRARSGKTCARWAGWNPSAKFQAR